MKGCSVLIAVQPPAFARLIEHVLQADPFLRVVGRGPATKSPSPIRARPLTACCPAHTTQAAAHSPVRRAARLAPDVIIASTRLDERESGGVLAALKRSSPASTLILLTHRLGAPVPHREADACLPEDAVVRRLLPVIRKVVHRMRDRAPRRARS